MTWTILYLHFLIVDSVAFVGEFQTQKQCIVALQDAYNHSGTEIPADLRQCVFIEKAKLEEYVRINEEDYQIRQRVLKNANSDN
jgi:hypothetical protein